MAVLYDSKVEHRQSLYTWGGRADRDAARADFASQAEFDNDWIQAERDLRPGEPPEPVGIAGGPTPEAKRLLNLATAAVE